MVSFSHLPVCQEVLKTTMNSLGMKHDCLWFVIFIVIGMQPVTWPDNLWSQAPNDWCCNSLDLYLQGILSWTPVDTKPSDTKVHGRFFRETPVPCVQRSSVHIRRHPGGFWDALPFFSSNQKCISEASGTPSEVREGHAQPLCTSESAKTRRHFCSCPGGLMRPSRLEFGTCGK